MSYCQYHNTNLSEQRLHGTVNMQKHCFSWITEYFKWYGKKVQGNRTVHVQQLGDKNRNKFCSNKIKTTKYTLWNIIPLNFYHQLSTRYIYIYFVICPFVNLLPWVRILQPIPSFMGIFFVILATLIKDAVEDFRRARSDHFVKRRYKILLIFDIFSRKPRF